MGYGETIRCGVGRLSSFQLGSPEDRGVGAASRLILRYLVFSGSGL